MDPPQHENPTDAPTYAPSRSDWQEALSRIVLAIERCKGLEIPEPHHGTLRGWDYLDIVRGNGRHWRDDPRFLYWAGEQKRVSGERRYSELTSLLRAMTGIRHFGRTLRLSVFESEELIRDLRTLLCLAGDEAMLSGRVQPNLSYIEYLMEDAQREFESHFLTELQTKRMARDSVFAKIVGYSPKPANQQGAAKTPRGTPIKDEPTAHIPELDPRSFGPGVYVIEGLWPGAVKVGQSTHIASRMRSLAERSPNRLRLLAVLSANIKDEVIYHHRWSRLRLHPKRELFLSADDLLDHVTDINSRILSCASQH